MNKKIPFQFAIIIIAISAVLVVTMVLFISQEFNEFPEYNMPIRHKTNLKFSLGICDSTMDPYSPPEEGIIKKEWGDENKLTVEAYVKTVCGGAEITGDYKINGDSLVLEYRLHVGDIVTSCLCAHKLIYEITGLVRKDYIISLTRNILVQ